MSATSSSTPPATDSSSAPSRRRSSAASSPCESTSWGTQTSARPSDWGRSTSSSPLRFGRSSAGHVVAAGADEGHARRKGDRLRRTRRRDPSVRVPAPLTRQRQTRRDRPRLPRAPAPAPDPGGRLRRPLREVPVPGTLRRLACPRLRIRQRSARRGPGLRLPARLVRGNPDGVRATAGEHKVS